MPTLPIDPHITFDNTNNWDWFNLEGMLTPSRTRLFNFLITSRNGRFYLQILATGNAPFSSSAETNYYLQRQILLPLNEATLMTAVQACRTAWSEHLINYEVDGKAIFQEQFNFLDQEAFVRQRLLELALAGEALFNAIFFPHELDIDEDQHDTIAILNDIGTRLLKYSLKGSMWFRVTSSKFNIPWNMIYSHPITDREHGSDIRISGFWGYRHLIEHIPDLSESRKYSLDTTTPLQMMLHLDEKIDDDHQVECNARILRLLRQYQETSLTFEQRNYSHELRNLLFSPPLLSQVIYFCCHAEAEGNENELRIEPSFFTLTDEDQVDSKIREPDLEKWTGRDNNFVRGPLVFFNACQSAQMTSMFYRSLAHYFLRHGASAVIGTQTDIPAVFAGRFAEEFLSAFFKGGYDPGDEEARSVGKLLLDLRRSFWENYRNPLALLYSLYRGADVYLPHGLEEEIAAHEDTT